MRIPWVIHSFNAYEKFWDGMLSGYQKHFPCDQFDMVLLTDTEEHGKHDFGPFRVIYTGRGQWSDRLVTGLSRLDTDFLGYGQEDMWPTAQPPNIAELLSFMQQNDVWRLQISPIVQFYSLVGSKIPLYFHWKSKYLMSHQPSIWKKSFLLSCIDKCEDPWVNEYRATQRLNNESITGKIAIWPHSWFSHESVKNKLA